jgi:YVTN family beta-propeller protein
MIRTPAFLLALGLMLQIAHAGDPRLLVLNKADHTMSIIDPESGKTVATVPTGKGPHEVAVLPDGRTAVVANYGEQQPGNSLSIIDIAEGKEKRRVDLGPLMRPHGLAVVDGKVYFTAEMNRAIGRLDPETGAVDRIIGLGQDITHMVVASPDGRFLYTANILASTVTVIDRQTGKLEHIAVGPEPEGIDISRDGSELWVGHRVDGLVTVIDAVTRKEKDTLKVGDVAIRVKLTPDGKSALVSDPQNKTVVVIDRATRKEVKRLSVGELPVGVLIQPDGARAFVALMGEDRLAVIDLKTLEVTGHITTGHGPDGLGWASKP